MVLDGTRCHWKPMSNYRRPRIMFVCNEDLKAFVESYAKERNRTVSNLLETVVTEWVEGKKGNTEKVISSGKRAYILLAEKAKGKKLSDQEIDFIIETLPEYEYSKSDFD